MKKYITFYWSRKAREEKKKNKFKNLNEKYYEKYNRLEEIEKAADKKKKILITIKMNQKDFLDKEKQKYESIKERRYEYFKSCRNNKRIFDKNFTDDVRGIIDYQHCVLSRQKEIEEKNKLKRENCMESLYIIKCSLKRT